MKKLHISDLIREVGKEVDEIVEDIRKGVPQSVYIAEIKEGAKYWCENKNDFLPVPDEFIGTWSMDYADDLRYEPLSSYDGADWHKVKQVEITTFSWEPVK